jgi:hypothetical protein
LTEIAAAFAGLFSPAATTTAATTAGAAATSGFSLSTLFQGGATLLGAMSALSAGRADAEAAELAADDAAREVPLETLQGINRRTGIKAEMMKRVGELDTAYAATGTDLSFGTPNQARQEAFRQADLGLTSDVGTEQTRVARLQEREKAYRRRASRARAGGFFDALSIGLSGAKSIADRY